MLTTYVNFRHCWSNMHSKKAGKQLHLSMTYYRPARLFQLKAWIVDILVSSPSATLLTVQHLGTLQVHSDYMKLLNEPEHLWRSIERKHYL